MALREQEVRYGTRGMAVKDSGLVIDRSALDHLVEQSGKFLALLFVFSLPFQRVLFLRENLFGLQGLKPFNLLSAAVLACLFFQGTLLSATDRIEQKSLRIFLVYFAIFTVTLIRSVPNAPLFHSRLPDVFPESYFDYILSSCITPALYVLPFLFILKNMRSFKELDQITVVICLSISLLSVSLIALVLMNPSALSGNRDEMADLCETYFGVGYNTIGTIYICTAPLLLHKLLTRNAYRWIVPMGLALVTILLLQSRSALITVAVSCCLYLVWMRRFGILIAGAGIFGIALFLFSGPTIDALLSIGFVDSSDFSADAVLTGRVDYIWIPLLDEWTSNIGLFLFGAGRYGIVTSEQWDAGTLIHAAHAHNAILDFFVDCGALFTCALIVFLLIGVATALRVGRQLNSALYWALFTCIFGFGIGMFTEREIFPTVDNMYVFPIIAMMINLARLHALGGREIAGSYRPASPRHGAASRSM